MIVAIPYWAGDVDLALTLVEFISQLGGCHEYDALLVADAAVDWAKSSDLITIANRTFRTATLICTDASVIGWKTGANALWLLAARHCQAIGADFLWLEPDAIPLKRGWLVSIDKMRGVGYFGHIYDCKQAGMPAKVMSGIAVYPANAYDLLAPIIATAPATAFDVSSADAVVPLARSTRLIQHLWGEMDLPPTFVEARTVDTPRNAFTIEDLSAEAVIFHRNKDQTLIQLLRRRLNLAAPDNFVVVLPFCNLDVNLMIQNLEWMIRIGTPKTHDCLLSRDVGTNGEATRQVLLRAKELFCTIHQTSYNVPHGTRFPQTAAWQHAARTMHSLYRNWLWLEADAVPLKARWLEVLQSVYDNCRMPFCGPIVATGMHLNGTAIYPANTPEICPRTMSHTNNAFDVEMKDEMIHLCKDIGHIFQHVWGVKDGQLNPLEGEPPTFPKGSPLLNQIYKTAVVIHRVKDGSLIERLRETL